MTHDLDTLRNQLLACRQRSIELDQARIDAEMARRAAVASERVAVDRLRAVEAEMEKLSYKLKAAANSTTKPEPVNERLLMRVKQLEAERASNQR